MMKRLVFLLLLSACSPEEPRQPVEPVVVYAAFEDDSALADMFHRYKEETGVLVIVRRGPAGKIVDDLIDNDISPPADVLMTTSVIDAWRAAEEGALRPLSSDLLREHVPDWARDADDLWFGTGFRDAVIVHDISLFEASAVADFAALAEQRYVGSLCLTSSALAINRTVIAMMIGELGVRPTELLVRDWMKNLVVPPFEDEQRLIAAFRAGTCGIAVMSRAAAAGSGLQIHEPAVRYGNVETIGIARHARNPAGAVALAEWLVMENDEMQIGRAESPTPVNVSRIAWNYDEAIKLAERARYR